MLRIKKRSAFVVFLVTRMHAGFVKGVRYLNLAARQMDPEKIDKITSYSPRVLLVIASTLVCLHSMYLSLMVLFPESRDELRKRLFEYDHDVWRDHVKALRFGFTTVELYRKDRDEKRNAWLEKRKNLMFAHFKETVSGMEESTAKLLYFDLYKARMYRRLHEFATELDKDRDLFTDAARAIGWDMNEMSLQLAAQSEGWFIGKALESEPQSLEDMLLERIMKMEDEANKGCGLYFELFEPRLLRRLIGFREQILNAFETAVAQRGWNLSEESLAAAERGEEEVLAEIRAEAA